MNQIIRKTVLSAVVAATALGVTAQVWAHHSMAMFDNTKEVVLDGTVKEFQWTNPHIWIQLMVEQDGKQVEFSIEGSSPNGLVRRGWSRNSLKPGEHVKVKIHPLKDGNPGGSFVSATFPDGRVLGERGGD